MPAHSHNIVDMDRFFIIDPETRAISVPEGYRKTKLVQYDHDSERYTFEIPRYVEGHDMSVSTMIQIHYLNVSEDKLKKNVDVYQVSDISVVDEEFVNFSWLISRNATQLAGLLSWAISFTCVENDVEIYKWNTTIYPGVEIAESLSNGNIVVEQYSDLLNEWYSRLFGLGNTLEQRLVDASLEQQRAIERKGEETLADIPGDLTALQADINGVKDDLDEIFDNVQRLNLSVGVDYILTPTSIETMIGSDGSIKNATEELPFYQMDVLLNSNMLHVQLEFIPTNNIYWFNQFDENGELLSHAPFYGSKTNDFYIQLVNGCKSVKISIWKDGGDFKISSVQENKIEKNKDQIEKNKDQIEKNKDQIEKNKRGIATIFGGDVYFYPKQSDSMYGSDGAVQYPNENIRFIQIEDVEEAKELIFYFQNKSSSPHWFNQFDENGELLSHAPFYKEQGEYVAKLNSLTKSVKVSVWTENGEFTAKYYTESKMVQKSEIETGYNKVSAIGDSITQGYWQGGTVENTYQKLIAQKLGANFQNLGVSSTSICPNTNYTDEQNKKAFVYRYTQIENDSDLILVCGGTNDFRHLAPLGSVSDDSSKYEQTFYGAVDYIINKIMEAHPLSRLVFITPFHQENDTHENTTLDGEKVYLSNYIDALKEKCKRYGVLCIDGFAESGVSLMPYFVNNYMPDSLHPNDDGHMIIYRNIMHYFTTL